MDEWIETGARLLADFERVSEVVLIEAAILGDLAQQLFLRGEPALMAHM